jgi:hypothetical protein
MATTNELYDVKEALDEYFKLKLKYETEIMKNKKNIIIKEKLSKREKRSEYLKLKPKCINCGRPGGTKFENRYFPSDDKDDSHRQYIATCGIIADPCGLNIKINVGNVELLPKLLDEMQTNIKSLKNEVIGDKNKLLFGYLSTEDVLNKFEDLKEQINSYTLLYEQYLEKYNELVDNPQKNSELNESITESFFKIDEIKECIKNMNEKNNVQFARDAVNIYTTTLQPLLVKIQTLKYNENMVWHNSDTNTCNLMQTRHSIANLSYTSYSDKVISFEKGVKTIKKEINKNVSLPTSQEMPEEMPQEMPEEVPQEMPEEVPQEMPEEVPQEVPEEVKSNPEYANLWGIMPSILKYELRKDPEWMKETMENCIIARKTKKPYAIKPPKNLKVPPELMPNGEYNFGSKIYNDGFNKMDEATKNHFTLKNDSTTKYDWDKYIYLMNNNSIRSIGIRYIGNRFIIPDKPYVY